MTATSKIPVAVVLRDATGTKITTGSLTNQRVQITITQPATADDTVVIVGNVSNSGGAVSGNNSQNLQDDSVVNLGTLGFQVRSTFPGGPAWGDVLPSGSNAVSDAGTYTITARLFNTATGAVVSTATMPLNLIANSAATAAGAAFISGPALGAASINVLDRLGVTGGSAVTATAPTAPQSFAVWVTDPAGGPYITVDDSVSVAGAAVASSGTIKTQGGWDTYNALASTTDLRIYASTATGSPAYTATAGNVSMTASVTAAGTGTTALRGSSTLPVSVSSVQSATSLGGVPTVTLDNTGAFFSGVAVTDDSYQVLPGTTKLTFTVITATGSASDTTVPFNGWSTASLSSASPTGGVSIQKADTGAIEVTLPAAAAASGESFFLTSGVGTNVQTVEVDFTAPAPLLDANTPLVKLASAAAVTGTITDQYGNALPGTWVVTAKAAAGVSCSATSIATATADAKGAFSITIPATFSPTLPGVATFGLCASNGITTVPALGGAQAEYIQYTTSGGVSSLTIAMPSQPASVSATVRPLIKTPAAGTAVIAQTTTVKNPAVADDSANINASGSALNLVATVAPQVAVTFTGTDGVLFTTRSGGAIFYADADKSVTVDGAASPPTASTATSDVWVIATKPGLHTVTATAGTSTATYTFYAAVPNNAARTLAVTPSSFDVAPNSFKSMKFSVKDIFGNPVPFYGGLSVVQAGGGTLSPATGSVVTNGLGEAEQFYTAPAGTGDVRLDYTGGGSGGGGLGGAWVTGDIPGAPAAVRTATVNIKVTTGGSGGDKTIVIVGERGTVSGKSGIIVDGATTGLEAGKTVIPYVRFPGGEYTQGTARPKLSAAGDFEWSRKTGKKSYVYFTNDDGKVTSNRIIIAAS